MPFDFGAVRGAPQQESLAPAYAGATAAERDKAQQLSGPGEAIAAFFADQLHQRRQIEGEEREQGYRTELMDRQQSGQMRALEREYQLRTGLVEREQESHAAGQLLLERQKEQAKRETEELHMKLFNHAITGREDIVEMTNRSLLEATPYFGMSYAEAIRNIKAKTPGADDEVAAEIYKGLQKKVPVVRLSDPAAYSMKFFELLRATGNETAAQKIMEQTYGHPAANAAEEMAQLYEAGSHEFPQFFPHVSVQASNLGPPPAAAGNIGRKEPFEITPDNAGDVMKDWSQIGANLVAHHYGEDSAEGIRILDTFKNDSMFKAELEDQQATIKPTEGGGFEITAKDPRFGQLLTDYALVNPAVGVRMQGLMQRGAADITNANVDKLGLAGKGKQVSAPTSTQPAPSSEENQLEDTIGDYLKKAKSGGK